MSTQMSIDEFLDRLSAVESGGNPNAVNSSSGAQGLFQILPSNWTAWARAAGKDPSDHSAANQRAVAAHQIQQYYNQFHSWEAVAVAWYAGPLSAADYMRNPNDERFGRRQGDQHEYPSINNYVQRVMSATPTSGTDGGGQQTTTMQTPGGGGGGLETPANAQVAIPGDQDLMTAFGWSSVLADIPELKKIMDDAVAQHWTPDAIQAAVMQTAWYKQRNSNQIQWEVEKRLHPNDAFQKANDLARKLQDDATKIGFTLDNDRANNMAVQFLTNGFTTDQQSKALQAEFHFDPAHPQGAAATTAAQLKQAAAKMLVPLSDQAIGQWVTDISTGKSTVDTFDQYLRDQAKSLFPSMAAAIDAGQTVAQYADPYRQIASQELNLNPDSINMQDPKWLRALVQTDPKTGARAPMSLDQWTATIRSDPQYGFDSTIGAQNKAAQLSSDLQRAMGVPL